MTLSGAWFEDINEAKKILKFRGDDYRLASINFGYMVVHKEQLEDAFATKTKRKQARVRSS